MGFKWKCPECEQVHEYGGKATTKATARCGSKNLKIWQYRILPPKPPEKPPQATNKYKSSMIHRPSKIQFPIDNVNWVLILKILDRGYSTIKNKPDVKAKKGGYYYDSLTWEAEIKKIKEIAKVMKLMGDEK